MSTRSDDGIKLGNITIRLVQGRNIKLIISRNDRKGLPHLTISWQNLSKEIDIHLKERVSGGNERHIPLAIIPERDFERAIESLGVEMHKMAVLNLAKVRKVRPGWLARNGYVLLHLPPDIQKHLIQKYAPKQKRHGKWTYVVDETALTNLGDSQEIINHINHPSVLNELAGLNYNQPVFAEGNRKKHKRRVMALWLMHKPNGKAHWVRIDNLTSRMMQVSDEIITSSIKQLLPEDIWPRIYSELCLNEIGCSL